MSDQPMTWCPVCNHVAHDASGYQGCQQLVPQRAAPCGCTFSLERLQRGEADITAGRVQSLEAAVEAIRKELRGAAPGAPPP